MVKHWIPFPLLMLATISELGCYAPHAQDSPIVRQVEAAGAGNLSTYTVQGLVQWFSTRPELARQISSECSRIAGNTPANWVATAEGTTCRAAGLTAPPPVPEGDQRTW
jgi:hypothetical protein